MPLIKWIKKAIRLFIGPPSSENRDDSFQSTRKGLKHKPEVLFESITITEKTPSNDSIGIKDFVYVVYKNKPHWVLFRCPCGCNNVINLSLQEAHNPRWSVMKSSFGRPTLHPSIWQNKGCCSHFWIEDGRVYWCVNTGIEPCVAEPNYYRKRK